MARADNVHIQHTCPCLTIDGKQTPTDIDGESIIWGRPSNPGRVDKQVRGVGKWENKHRLAGESIR